MNSWLYFMLFLKGSLLSTGGFGNLPILHEELLKRGWATERDFAESLTLGQITPGPNGLWVLCLGYMMGGVKGSLLALLAITLPPLLVLIVERFYRSVRDHPAAEGFVRGLSLAVIGTFAVALTALLQGMGISLQSVCFVILSLILAATGRFPVIAIIGLAAGGGILFHP
jgi:chromate transporter